MKHIYTTFSLLLILGTGSTIAQELDPGWLWAERGGSSTAISGSQLHSSGMERIVDIAVDSENNYYYLTEVGGFNFNLGDMEFSTSNDQAQSTDIFIFSTDQDGDFRWSKTIGGGFRDVATSINVDENGNVYVSGNAFNFPASGAYPTPVHFDTDTIMPQGTSQPSSANKKIFLIKYDADGNFQWLRQPEGDETPLGASGAMMKTVVEPDGTTHSLIWLMKGTYFDGQLVVEEGDVQSAIVRYNSVGEFEGLVLIDMKPLLDVYHYQLAYDSNLDRYYIADTNRDFNDILSINGHGVESGSDKAFYLAAVNNQGEVLWYQEDNYNGIFATGDLKLDEAGNIYFAGKFRTPSGSNPNSFAGYELDADGSSQIQNPFLIKLDSEGNLVWGTNAQSYSPFNGQSIVVAGDNVYLGLGMLQNNWGEVSIPGPSGMGLVPDIQIIKFDAQTGEALEVIQNNAVTPSRDMVMAMALDNNSDLVVGGYFGSQLFSGSDFHLSNTGQGSDFFIAKYHLPADTTNEDTLSTINTINRDAQMIRVYPNPTTGMVNLRSDIGLISYTLHDLQGRVVAQGSLRGNQIDLSAREAGLYVLIVVDQYGSRYNFRIVRE